MQNLIGSVLLDANNDGYIDIASSGLSELFLYTNLQGNGFYESLFPQSFNAIWSICAADIDNNNDLDMIIGPFAQNGGNDLVWFRNLPNGPIASFELNECSKEIINTSFADYSTSEFYWNFGNDSLSNEPFAKFPFSSPGTHEIELVICDNELCNTTAHQYNFTHGYNHLIPEYGEPNEELFFSVDPTGFSNCTWDFGDDNFSLDFDATHIYQQSGEYSVDVYLTDSTVAGCTVVDSFDILVGDDVHVNHYLKGLPLVFPNPAKDFVQLETFEPYPTVVLHLLDGREVKKVELNERHAQIDISDLESGTYLLRFVRNGSADVVQKLFIAN